MIEIIPNWHPIFVHFTIGLLGSSVVLFLVATLICKAPVQNYLAIMARGTLWLGVLMTVATVLTGLQAFDTVPHHSAEQHLAMLDHRNWALSTAALFIFLALWSLIANWRGKSAFRGVRHVVFLVLILVAGSLLLTTGYKGGELVFRHGIGVLAVPAPTNGDHGHNGHHDDHNHDHHPH